MEIKRVVKFDLGFTLIELALVTVLILVIVGLAAPTFKKTFSGLILKNSALSISKFINYAQEKAIIEQKNYMINFDFKNNQYQLFKSDGSTGKSAYKYVAGKFGRLFSVPDGLSISGSANEIVLYPDGTCDEFLFTIVDRYGSGYSVSVKGFGARFDMREVNFEK